MELLIERLFDLALTFEYDNQLTEESDLEGYALHGATATLFKRDSWFFLREVLHMLPYEASSSTRALLDHFCMHPKIKNSYKAIIMKTGLYLLNPYGRIAFYILIGSLLYTWETITKLRKPIDNDNANIYYMDVPSYQSWPDARCPEESLPTIQFRD